MTFFENVDRSAHPPGCEMIDWNGVKSDLQAAVEKWRHVQASRSRLDRQRERE
jgi:hypothetical protein